MHRPRFIMWDGFIKIYPIGEINILNNAKSDHDDYDNMQVTLLCLDGKPAGKENMVEMLDVALANGMPVEEKIRQLETKYDIKVTNGLEGRLETMCNYSKGVYDDGMEKGMAKGIDTGIAGAVDILKRMGMTTSKIVEQLMLQYGLSKEDADKYVRQAEPQ